MKKHGFYILLILFFLVLTTSAFAQSSKKNLPKRGESITEFLERNNCMSEQNYKEFIRINKDKIGKENTLYLGVEYTLPSPTSPRQNQKATTPQSTRKAAAPASKTPKPEASQSNTKRREPLFGKGKEEYTLIDNSLAGACFFLSSGHGGPDPGTTSKINGHEVHEDEYAYDITLRLARCLMEHGAKVYMIIQDKEDGIRDDKYLKNSKRETCMGKTIPLNQVKRLQQRTEKINELSRASKEKHQRAVFIHLDSRSKKQQTDVYFYHSKSKASQQLAETVRKTFESHYKKHQPNRGFSGTVSRRDLYVLNNSRPVAVFAEVGNIQNQFDQKRFILADNRQALANWFYRALAEDYKNSKK